MSTNNMVNVENTGLKAMWLISEQTEELICCENKKVIAIACC